MTSSYRALVVFGLLPLTACQSTGRPRMTDEPRLETVHYFSPSGPGEVLVGTYQERERLRLAENAGSDVLLSAEPMNAPKLNLLISLGYGQRFALRSRLIGYTCEGGEHRILTITSIVDAPPSDGYPYPKLLNADAELVGIQRSVSLDVRREYQLQVNLPACASHRFSVLTPEFVLTGRIYPPVEVAFEVRSVVKPFQNELFYE